MSTGQQPGQEPSIRALIASAKEDAQRLAKAQLDLAKLELSSSGQAAGKTGGLFVGAAVLGFLGFVFLLVTLAYVLVAFGLPVWAGFGIVTLLLLIVAGLMAFLGRSSAKKIKGPDLAIAELERTKAVLAGAAGQPEAAPATLPALPTLPIRSAAAPVPAAPGTPGAGPGSSPTQT